MKIGSGGSLVGRHSSVRRTAMGIRYTLDDKRQSKYSRQLCLMLLGIVVISSLYLAFMVHFTVNPATLGNEIQYKWQAFQRSMRTFPSLQSESHESNESSSIIYGVVPSPSSLPTSGKRSISERCPNRKIVPKQVLPVDRRAPGASNLHFIHIPKCGGTSMTAVLREMVCAMNPEKNVDCCTNPGFCDWHAFRRCSVIKGCTDHFPNRAWIFKAMPSVALFRNPVSRLLSAWFYRGHSPNLDFFQVRPWFKEIHLGLRPKVVFDEYIEMVEYQNIQTRMLGADSFPYRNITITEQVFCDAVDALDHLFFVGLQEAYDISVEAILREFNMNITVEVKKERDQGNKQISEQKARLKNNETLMNRVKENNHYDLDLYGLAVEKFCSMIRRYPDLRDKLHRTTSVTCN